MDVIDAKNVTDARCNECNMFSNGKISRYDSDLCESVIKVIYSNGRSAADDDQIMEC